MINIWKPGMKESEGGLQRYLQPTRLIDSTHPDVAAKAESLRAGAGSAEETVRHLFYFIRDEVRYAFRVKYREEAFFASNILKKRFGFCTQKAILFCALARSCGIPAGIHFYDIVDHTLSDKFVEVLQTNVLYHHGIAVLHLNGAWRQYDATLDIHLVKSKGLQPVEFAADTDCLMEAETPAGGKHVEYIRDYGMVADVSTEDIKAWFREGYPHLFERHAE